MNWTIDSSLVECTLPQLLRKRHEQTPRYVAMRHKDFGVWHELTWQEVGDNVSNAAIALLKLGVDKDDKVAIIADNIPEWSMMELAAQSVGAVSIGIYPSSVRDEVYYLLEYSEAKVVLCEDQEQADKVLDIRDRLPKLEHIIVEDPRGMREELQDDVVMAWSELLQKGKAHPNDKVDGKALHQHLSERIAAGNADDICHFATTSGTTGRPKATMLSHRNYLSMAYAMQQVDPVAPLDDYVSFLPFAWIVEQVFGVALPLLSGMVVNFPESSETAMSDLKEIGPHMMLGAPRVWEGMQSQIWVKMDESYGFNRWMYQWLMAIGKRTAKYRMQRKFMPPHLWLGYHLANNILFRPLKDRLGFLRLKRAYTGGAALGPDTFSFYQGMGVNLKQVYGQTETAGLAYIQRDGEVKPDTVGKPLPSVELKISEEGEVLTKCDGVCHGYYQKPEAFKDALDAEGWFRSGDAGYIDDDGHLVIIDRLGDVAHTASGHMFSPQFIENKLKFSPFIKEAVVYGDAKNFISCFINVDPLTVGKWAEARGISYTTYADLAQNQQVAALIFEEVKKVNASLPQDERIARFVLLYKLLDADDEELTRTGKVRRGFIATRYEDILNTLYDTSKKEVHIKAEFRYQDGQKAEMETDVTIWETAHMQEVQA